MKHAAIAIILMNMVLSVCAREFNAHWIYAPQSDGYSHVWFRRLFISSERPRHATITVASTGYYKLYVNECNVGTALFYPYRESNDTTAIESTFDITPYLRPDSNVIAILYSPTMVPVSGADQPSHRQISVSVYGKIHDDSAFSYVSDESWLCRRANSCMTSDGGEFIDGRSHDASWKAATIYNQALWMPAQTARGAFPEKNDSNPLHLLHVSPYTSNDLTSAADGTQVLEQPYGFYGFVRATIREARKGENMTFGNLRYTCNGQIDEQAYPCFSLGYWRTIPLSGDNHFKASQIVNLEIVTVARQKQ